MSALNILLVDNNRNLVTTLSDGLRKAMGKAISVAVCFSGSQALSMLAAQRFDVVVSEFNMPGMSGFELINKIRHDYRETILVLTTAYGTDSLEEEVHRLGIGYITKPFGLSLLVQFIHDLIRRRTDKERIRKRAAHPDPGSEEGYCRYALMIAQCEHLNKSGGAAPRSRAAFLPQ
jgi:DNA-binding response OmpR family regulator